MGGWTFLKNSGLGLWGSGGCNQGTSKHMEHNVPRVPPYFKAHTAHNPIGVCLLCFERGVLLPHIREKYPASSHLGAFCIQGRQR
jgi:hypothetical protein